VSGTLTQSLFNKEGMPQYKTKINFKNNQIIFRLKTKNYPMEAIYAAAYIFVSRAYVYLDGDPAKEINVFLKGKEKMKPQELKSLQGEFLNELLNYLIRLETTRVNQKIREYVVASALVSALPQEILAGAPGLSDMSKRDWQNDPLGIAVPWEKRKKQKNAGKKKKTGKRAR
jgi:His-Xaa-Ser system protein HxsD